MKKLIYIFLLIGLPLFGQTTYHIATDGSGDYTTITQLNAASFSPGDTIAFRAGDIWSICDDERWILDDNGTSESRIVVTKYGEGVDPILTARDTVEGMSTTGNWTNTSGNIWRYDLLTTQTQRFWVDGNEMTKCLDADVTAIFRWNYTSSSLYFYSEGNPASNYTLFQYTGQGAFLPEFTYVLYLGGNYITLEHLDIRGGYMTLLMYGSDVIIDSCNIGAYVDENGIYWDGADRGEIKNCTLDTKCTVDNQIYDNPTYTEDGINIRGNVDGLLIHDNYFKNWQHGAIHPQGGLNGVNDTISDLLIYDNDFTAPDLTYGYAINYVGATGTLPGSKAFRNYIHHMPLYSAFSCDGVEFYNNVIDSIFGNPATYHNDSWRSSGVFFYQSSAGDAFGAENNKIFNNTFIDCEDAAFGLANLVGTNVKDNNQFVNNLIYNCGRIADPDMTDHHFSIYLDFGGYEYWGIQTFRNNGIYSPYHPTGDSLIYYGKRGGPFHSNNWTGISGFNADNLNESYTYPDTIENNFLLDSDPFVDYEGGDYRLAESVNAINAGIDVGLTTDFLGNEIVGLPDVGAYEYTSGDPEEPSTPYYIPNPHFSLGGSSFSINGKKLK